MKAILHTDGGARGNPGPAGIGVVLHLEGGATIEASDYLGEATNNYAEYAALKRGLELALAREVTELTCYLDSELIVKQLKGEYRVKHALLSSLYKEVQKLVGRFERISFNHVGRAQNKKADRLVNSALDQAAAKD